MKKSIHPTYHKDVKITCACGAAFTVGSTEEKLEIEICSQCHPFYTGVEKVVDTAGRVEKFKARSAFAKASADKRQVKNRAARKAEKRAKREKVEKA